MAGIIQFTFVLKGSGKMLKEKDSEFEEVPYISVFAKKYEQAVKKVLRLGIPGVLSEEDIEWQSILEVDDDGLPDEAAPKEGAK